MSNYLKLDPSLREPLLRGQYATPEDFFAAYQVKPTVTKHREEEIYTFTVQHQRFRGKAVLKLSAPISKEPQNERKWTVFTLGEFAGITVEHLFLRENLEKNFLFAVLSEIQEIFDGSHPNWTYTSPQKAKSYIPPEIPEMKKN